MENDCLERDSVCDWLERGLNLWGFLYPRSCLGWLLTSEQTIVRTQQTEHFRAFVVGELCLNQKLNTIIEL